MFLNKEVSSFGAEQEIGPGYQSAVPVNRVFPATGLLIYNTATTGTAPDQVIPGFYYWNGSSWLIMAITPEICSTGMAVNECREIFAE